MTGSQFTIFVSGMPFSGEEDFITEEKLILWSEGITGIQVVTAIRVMRKRRDRVGEESGDIGCAMLQFQHPLGARRMSAAYHRKLLVRNRRTNICCVEASRRDLIPGQCDEEAFPMWGGRVPQVPEDYSWKMCAVTGQIFTWNSRAARAEEREKQREAGREEVTVVFNSSWEVVAYGTP